MYASYVERSGSRVQRIWLRIFSFLSCSWLILWNAARFSQCLGREASDVLPVAYKNMASPLNSCSLIPFIFLLVLVHLSFVLMEHASVPNVSMHNRRGIAKPLEEIKGHMISHIKDGKVCFVLSWSFLSFRLFIPFYLGCKKSSTSRRCPALTTILHITLLG